MYVYLVIINYKQEEEEAVTLKQTNKQTKKNQSTNRRKR